MKFTWTILVIGILFSLSLARAEGDGTGLKISGSGDLVGQAGLHSGGGSNDRLDVREAELTLFAPVDHLFDANISFAAHYEGGVPMMELHEAWLGSSKIIPRSRFKVGQYFFGIGRLNQFHRHDWPFTSAPKVFNEMFDPTGHPVGDTGLEYSYLLPLPIFLELTAGIANGLHFGHAHVDGPRPAIPTHYARLATYANLPGDGGTQIALNYIRRKTNDGIDNKILGVDLTAKWRDSAILTFLLQSEFWYRVRQPGDDPTQKAFGFYVYPQYYLGENIYAGLRLDYFSHTELPDATGATSKNFDVAFVPNITYKPSEFSLFRLSYNHGYSYLVDRYSDQQRYIEAQAIFILGAHPAHDF